MDIKQIDILKEIVALGGTIKTQSLSNFSEWRGASISYAPDVERLFDLISRSELMDPNYVPATAGENVLTASFIEGATLDEPKPLFTLVVRAERFGEGAFGSFIADGTVERLIKRLGMIT